MRNYQVDERTRSSALVCSVYPSSLARKRDLCERLFVCVYIYVVMYVYMHSMYMYVYAHRSFGNCGGGVSVVPARAPRDMALRFLQSIHQDWPSVSRSASRMPLRRELRTFWNAPLSAYRTSRIICATLYASHECTHTYARGCVCVSFSLRKHKVRE